MRSRARSCWSPAAAAASAGRSPGRSSTTARGSPSWGGGGRTSTRRWPGTTPTASSPCRPTSPSQRRPRASATVTEHFGQLDVLVNNAAKYFPKDFADIDHRRVGRVHARRASTASCTSAQQALPGAGEDRGNLVAVGSVSGCAATGDSRATTPPRRGDELRAVAGAGLRPGAGCGSTRSAPAFTQTEATAAVGSDEESLRPFVNRIALGRPGQPEDVAPGGAVPGQRGRRLRHRCHATVDGGTSASTGQPHVE